MKFATYLQGQTSSIGILSADETVIIPWESLSKTRFSSMNELIQNITPEELKSVAEKSNTVTHGVPLSEIVLLSPMQSTAHDIICVGENYKGHQDEMQKATNRKETVKKIMYFSKRVSHIHGTGAMIDAKFDINHSMDYEAELAVVIGKEGVNIAPEAVEEHIFGYSVFNDLTSRNIQTDHVQWFRGKSLDGFAAMGPVITHKSALPLPLGLGISCTVNDEVRQSSNTADLMLDIIGIVSEISTGMTLYPGDIILTGTPAGVGIGFQPPKYLKSGDVVVCEIEGIGKLLNKIQ